MAFQKLVFFGDSVTEGFGDGMGIGWPGRVAGKVAKTHKDHAWTFSNLGVGGDTIVDGKHRFASGVLTRDTTHIVLSFGTNDSSIMLWPDESTGTKLSLPFAKQNWMRLFDHIRALNIKCAVVGVLPVEESKFPFLYRAFDENDHGILFRNDKQEVYNAMVEQTCAAANVPFINLFPDWMGRDLGQMLCDGVHPSTAGYDVMGEQIFEQLEAIKFFS